MEQNYKKHRSVMGIRISAIRELVLFLAVALVLDTFVFSGNRFIDVNPHPFWIIVLLLAAHYGTAEGLLAAVACSVALLLFNMPVQELGQDQYAYLFEVAYRPLLWLVTAVVLGELRMKHVRERTELRTELEDAREREEKITQTYQWTRGMKEKLELRIAGKMRSTVAAYRAARSMEAQSEPEVLDGLEELVSVLVNPEKFSVFLVTEEGMKMVRNRGWEEREVFPPQVSTKTALYQQVAEERRTLAVADAEQERILSEHGMLAAPLLDKVSGEVLGMVKIEKLGFTELHLSSIETLSAIGEWAGSALANSRRYQLAKDESFINPDYNLYTRRYFDRFSDYLKSLGRRVGFDVSMIFIRLQNAEKLADDKKHAIAVELSRAVGKVLRSIDEAFEHQGPDAQFSIVLPATSRDGANVVVNKIRQELTKASGSLMDEAHLTFSVHALHEHTKEKA